MSKDVFKALPIIGPLVAGSDAPKINISEAAVPPPPPVPEPMPLPDELDPAKRKKRQADVMRTFSGGSASTILSQKLGG